MAVVPSIVVHQRGSISHTRDLVTVVPPGHHSRIQLRVLPQPVVGLPELGTTKINKSWTYFSYFRIPIDSTLTYMQYHTTSLLVPIVAFFLSHLQRLRNRTNFSEYDNSWSAMWTNSGACQTAHRRSPKKYTSNWPTGNRRGSHDHLPPCCKRGRRRVRSRHSMLPTCSGGQKGRGQTWPP